MNIALKAEWWWSPGRHDDVHIGSIYFLLERGAVLFFRNQ